MKKLIIFLSYSCLLLITTPLVYSVNENYIKQFIAHMKTEKLQYQDQVFEIFGTNEKKINFGVLALGGGLLLSSAILAFRPQSQLDTKGVIGCTALAVLGAIMLGGELLLSSPQSRNAPPLIIIDDTTLINQKGELIPWINITAIGLVQYIFGDINKNSKRMEGQTVQCYDAHGNIIFSVHENDLPITGHNLIALLEHYLSSAGVKYVRRAAQLIKI
jgi:hypothetical protein